MQTYLGFTEDELLDHLNWQNRPFTYQQERDFNQLIFFYKIAWKIAKSAKIEGHLPLKELENINNQLNKKKIFKNKFLEKSEIQNDSFFDLEPIELEGRQNPQEILEFLKNYLKSIYDDLFNLIADSSDECQKICNQVLFSNISKLAQSNVHSNRMPFNLHFGKTLLYFTLNEKISSLFFNQETQQGLIFLKFAQKENMEFQLLNCRHGKPSRHLVNLEENKDILKKVEIWKLKKQNPLQLQSNVFQYQGLAPTQNSTKSQKKDSNDVDAAAGVDVSQNFSIQECKLDKNSSNRVTVDDLKCSWIGTYFHALVYAFCPGMQFKLIKKQNSYCTFNIKKT